MKLIDLVHSEGDKGSYLPSLLELTQALGGLVADVANAKRFSNVQLDLLDQRLEEFKSKSNSLTEERDEVIEERDGVIEFNILYIYIYIYYFSKETYLISNDNK